MRRRAAVLLAVAGAIVLAETSPPAGTGLVGVVSPPAPAPHRRVQAAAPRRAPRPHIYISDQGNHRIVRLDDMTGRGWTAYGRFGHSAGQFAWPCGIFVDGAGRIYVADRSNNRIVRINDMRGSGWTALTGWDAGPLDHPEHVFVDRAGRVYVVDQAHLGDIFQTRLVRVNDMTGAGATALRFIQVPVTGVLPFDHPASVFVDAAGRIYATDRSQDRVVRVDDMTGAGAVTLGTGLRTFYMPSSVTVDAAGRVYVADAGNDRIVRVNDLSGRGWITLGTTGGGRLNFSLPRTVFVNGTGPIYVTDTGNDRLVRVNDMRGGGWITLGRTGGGVRQFRQPVWVFVR